jgi:hypothetical protein
MERGTKGVRRESMSILTQTKCIPTLFYISQILETENEGMRKRENDVLLDYSLRLIYFVMI